MLDIFIYFTKAPLIQPKEVANREPHILSSMSVLLVPLDSLPVPGPIRRRRLNLI